MAALEGAGITFTADWLAGSAMRAESLSRLCRMVREKVGCMPSSTSLIGIAIGARNGNETSGDGRVIDDTVGRRTARNRLAKEQTGKSEPRGDPGIGFAAVGIAFEIDGSRVRERTGLSRQRERSCGDGASAMNCAAWRPSTLLAMGRWRGCVSDGDRAVA